MSLKRLTRPARPAWLLFGPVWDWLRTRRRVALLLGCTLMFSVLAAWTGCSARKEAPAASSSSSESTSEIVTTGQRAPVGPLWNFWVENASQRVAFKPLASIPIKSDFSLVVDLSKVAISSDRVSAVPASRRLAEWLQSQTDSAPRRIEVLALVDGTSIRFQPDQPHLQYIDVSLARLRSTASTLDPQRALQILGASGDAEFDLGHVAFELTSGESPGSHNVGITFWTQVPGSGRIPVGEASVSVCIENPAPSQVSPCDSDSGGAQSAVAQLTMGSHVSAADATLDFIELDPGTTMGMFRCNSCRDWAPDEILTWQLDRGMAALAGYISGTLKTEFEQAADANNDPSVSNPDWSQYTRAGNDLYSLLFRSTRDSANAQAVRTRFEAFVRASVARDNISDPSGPHATLLVRIFPQHDDDFFVVPFDLLAVPVSVGKSEFLGMHFQIRHALYQQSPRAMPDCISHWQVLLPPQDLQDPLATEARPEIAEWIPVLLHAAPAISVNQDIAQFAGWLSPEGLSGPTSLATTSDFRSGLLLLSHHEGNRLFFDSRSQTPAIDSAGITRDFLSPSVAVIDACGTADPKAFDVVRQLNAHGVTAIVASTTKVAPLVGGKFLDSLLDVAGQAEPTAGLTLQRARLAALRSLANDKSIGPQVFSFGFFGEDDVKICLPARPHKELSRETSTSAQPATTR